MARREVMPLCATSFANRSAFAFVLATAWPRTLQAWDCREQRHGSPRKVNQVVRDDVVLQTGAMVGTVKGRSRGLTALVLLALVVLYVLAGNEFYQGFPVGHSWSELMLNYQGGFSKRALLGEAAFRLDKPQLT
jgi:hypothetical protein